MYAFPYVDISGQLSAHSSTEGVQNVGLTEPQRSESNLAILSASATGKSFF